MGKMGGSPLAGLAALGLGGLNSASTGGLNPAGKLFIIVILHPLKHSFYLFYLKNEANVSNVLWVDIITMLRFNLGCFSSLSSRSKH